MPKKSMKKITRSNIIEKYRVVTHRGNENAVNADGEKLEQQTFWVEVPTGYSAAKQLRNEEMMKKLGIDKTVLENIGVNQPGFSRHNLRISEHDEYESNSDNDSQFADAEDDDFFEMNQKRHKLSSSKVDCPENVKIFNEQFNKKFEEYKGDNIGGLEYGENEGYLTVESEFAQNLIGIGNKTEEIITFGSYDASIKEKILNYAKNDEKEKFVNIITEKPAIEYDCESILSTYSNQYNHPTVIKETKVQKIKIPDNPLRNKLTRSQLKRLDQLDEKSEDSDESEETEDSDDNYSVATSFNIRLKGETPEQRKERKNIFKAAKRESRILKKENKLAFKHEKELQRAQAINLQRNMAIRLL